MDAQSQPPQPIAENLWWVIPGKLAGVRKPAAPELAELQAAGVGAILSVMDDPSNLDAYKAANWPHCWVPVKGGTAPSSEQMGELKTFIDSQHEAGRAVAIHCTSGRRRTGTAIAAYLIASGATFTDAVTAVTTANPAVEMREAQLQFLQALAEES